MLKVHLHRPFSMTGTVLFKSVAPSTSVYYQAQRSVTVQGQDLRRGRGGAGGSSHVSVHTDFAPKSQAERLRAKSSGELTHTDFRKSLD